MNIQDNEICMLEQLCYLDTSVIKKATGVEILQEELSQKISKIKEKNGTVEQLLESLGFDDTALAKLEALGDKEVGGSCISGKEWADIIRYIKADENCGIQK